MSCTASLIVASGEITIAGSLLASFTRSVFSSFFCAILPYPSTAAKADFKRSRGLTTPTTRLSSITGQRSSRFWK